MSVYNYKKFKIALRSDSKKTQGLKVGDIVRRQYFNGTSTIYSLMCVLEIGTDSDEQKYFIGALLEGDEPSQNQLLDFARITNLFDTSRSGALYLTASDSEAPYMDVIDGIGRNESLCWPLGLAVAGNIDSTLQYTFVSDSLATTSYTKSSSGNNRILYIKKNATEGTVTLKQDFYKYVANPNRVLISYKIKSTRAITSSVSMEYVDGVRTDGTVSSAVTSSWQYKLHTITVDWSGRHLRSVKIALTGLQENDEVWISDFNIILLSSIAQFGDGSQIRIGKLDGIVDPVFGKLNGYGSYLQKMFSSGSAHISGTLTAGDENGFGSTFYAGKIHRNVFQNSIAPTFSTALTAQTTGTNPTGISNVYKITEANTLTAQTATWLRANIGKKFCFSFWAFANNPVDITVSQNGHSIGVIEVDSAQTHAWVRHSISFDVLEGSSVSEQMNFTLTPVFDDEVATAISSDTTVIAADTQVTYEDAFLFSAPQLESGTFVSQYQATDSVLNDTDDYGAWFNRGGIGGTIQNPLLKLNYDGQGSIGTQNNSLLLRLNGSGYLANSNIVWDAQGNVTFGENVTLDWDNLSSSAQQSIRSKSIKITGNNTIVVVKGGNNGLDAYSPASLTLGLSASNFTLSSATLQWQYKTSSGWTDITGATGTSLSVLPSSTLWDSENVIELRIKAVISGVECYDEMVLRKMFVSGYTVEVTSSQGSSFHNGTCQTVLQATIYYRGTKITDTEGFAFLWHKYTLPNTTTEDTTWYQQQTDAQGNVTRAAIDRTASQITLNYEISSQDYFVCTVSTTDMFVYDFPISF